MSMCKGFALLDFLGGGACVAMLGNMMYELLVPSRFRGDWSDNDIIPPSFDFCES
jgi:hypothetical protein